MFGGVLGSGMSLAFTNRPHSSLLTLCVLSVIAGWALLTWTRVRTRPARPEPIGAERPLPDDQGHLEPPAVVALLTNGYAVPPSAVPATVLDLASRGWIELVATDEEVVVLTRGNGRRGDVLQPFEQLVLSHLASQAFDGYASARTLELARGRLGGRWRRRFRRSVVRCARSMGLTCPRYTPALLARPGVAALAALVFGLLAWRHGDDEVAVGESLSSRTIWVTAMVASVILVGRVAWTWGAPIDRPTDVGARRAARWIGYRSRLRARIPERASVVAPPREQLALAHGLVVGVAEHVMQQIPIIKEDDHLAWSEAGGTPHAVRISYPMRPAYGRHPVVVAIVGLAVFIAAQWARAFLVRVADGEALRSLIDTFPEQVTWFERAAAVLASLMFVPIVWSVWALFAGIIDAFATVERVGLIVRARRPVEVVRMRRLLRHFVERDRFSVFLAVDDGARRRITAWMATERTAAPQGAQARVRATPLLGYVRSSEPVGTSARPISSENQ